MGNTIETRKQYATLLDKVYKLASLTSVLDGANELAREGANAGEILIPKFDMDGLADYSRQNGYTSGNVSLEYQTKRCDYDRGRRFVVDSLDNLESAGIAFGQLSGEFIRVKVAPELDAWRLSKYVGIEGVGTASGALATGKNALAALRAAITDIKNAEADISTCHLFINPTILGMIDDLDTTNSKKALEGWASIKEVPESRFWSEITLNAAGTGGFTPGGYALNFLIVDKQAVIQYQKHLVTNIFAPGVYQGSDGWAFDYRANGIAEVYDNKVKGVYAHLSETAAPQQAPSQAPAPQTLTQPDLETE